MTNERPRRDDDIRGHLDDELRHHLESRIRDLRRQGWSRADAEREARRRLGDPENIRRAVRREHRRADRRDRVAAWSEDLLRDVVIGLRRLLRSPGFTLLAVLTLAVGIGASTALFSVVEAVVLSPLPYPDSESLVEVWESEPSRGWDFFAVSEPNYLDYRAALEGRIDLAAIGLESFNLTGDGLPERLDAYRITANLLPVLGLEVLHGRGFSMDETVVGASPRVVLLGNRLWHRRFGSDPGIVGRSLTLDGADHRIVGVLPPLRPLLYDDALFAPLAADPAGNRSHHYLTVIGRLGADLDPISAERDLDTVAARLAERYPESNAGFDTRVMSLYESLVPAETRLALYVLLGAVGLVLLIACANLSNLMLARATDRRRDLAIYGALGASRGRLIRQLLTESCLVAALGALVGVLVALRASAMARSLEVAGVPRIDQVGVDLPVLVFTALVAAIAGILGGLAPALQGTGGGLLGSLGDGGRGTTGSRAAERTRRALVVAEIALAVTLLAGAGLLVRSLLHVRAQDPGIDVDRLLTMEINIPIASESDLRWVPAKVREILAAVEAIPGVREAATTTGLPFGPGHTVMDFQLEGENLDPAGGVPSAGWRLVSPGYFEAAGIELLRGRTFEPGDDLDGAEIAIISRRMAERHWPGENPIGRRFLGWRDPDRKLTVVGVVEDVRERRLESEAGNLVYLPYYKNPWWSDLFLVARADGDPASLGTDVRTAVAAVSPELPVAFVRPLSEVVADSLASRRFSTVLLASFAGIALLLAGAGVYGVVSYGVIRKRSEIGVRLAMGARRGAVVSLVVRRGMAAVSMGAGIGLLAAILASRLLASQLYGIQPWDPATLVGAVGFLVVVALVACLIPAVRAARLEPVETLREG